LTLQTNGTTTAVTVDTSQNVGIGTTSPSCRLNPTCSGTGTQEIVAFGMSNSTSGYSNYGRIRIGAESSTTGSEKGNVQFDAKYLGTYEEFLAYITQDRRLVFSTAGSERMRIDSSGNVLVGTTTNSGVDTGSQRLVVNGLGSNGAAICAIADTVGRGIRITDSGKTNTAVYDMSSTIATLGTNQSIPLTFITNGGERMRIDSSGNMFLGRTSQIVTGRFCVQNTAGSNTIETIQSGSGGYNYYSNAASNGGSYYHATFTEANTQRGSIVSNGSVTLYNTTSDQRLKENIVNAPEFGDVIDALQVRSFDWKSNQTHQRAGFIAQELVTVAPEAVHHPVNEEEMMAVDYSKLVPMLVKEIQSLRKRIVALESK
jgi:hypothetical protein